MSFMKSPREVTPVSNEHGNDHDVKNLKKSFHLSVLWILLLLVVFTGSTYAWFTLSGLSSTNVTPMAGTIGTGDTVLLISNSSNGPFDKSCELVLDGNPTSLKPISTADLQNFYKGTTQTKEGITVLYASADSEVNQDAIHGTVYLQCQNAACDVYFEPKNLNLGSDAQALAAMRLGLKITSSTGTQNLIFKLDALGSTGSAQSRTTISRSSAVVSSATSAGEPTYVDDPSLNISDYMAQAGTNENEYNAGSQSLLTLEKDEVASVEYWLYLEGCDEQCYDPIQNKDSQIQLAFAGVDVSANQ